MSDETQHKTYTERELVLAQRKAFEDGAVRWVDRARAASAFERDMPMSIAQLRADAAKQFPLPKVERPRVVHDPEWATFKWFVRHGILLYSHDGAPADVCRYPARIPGRIVPAPTAQRAALWADLFARPTELVESE
jgi:hypothetical protein